MNARLLIVFFGCVVFFASGCSEDATPEPAETTAPEEAAAPAPVDAEAPPPPLPPPPPVSIRTDLTPNFNPDLLAGVEFTQMPEGLRLQADLTGPPPGKYGLYLNGGSDCGSLDTDSGNGMSLGLLEVSELTSGFLETQFDQLAFFGDSTVMGRAVLVHDKERVLACGIVGDEGEGQTGEEEEEEDEGEIADEPEPEY